MEEFKNGSPDTTDNSTLSLSINTGPGGASLGGTTQNVPVINGIAKFTEVTANTVGTYTINANDSNSNYGYITSLPFTILSGSKSLQFNVEPANGSPVNTFIPFQVAVYQNGQILSTDNSTLINVTIAIPNGAAYGGGYNVPVVNGIADFQNVDHFDVAQLAETYGVVLQATASGDASATSDAFSVTPEAASRLIVSGPATATAGSSIPGFAFSLEDPLYDVMNNDSSSVSVSILSGPAGATIGGTLTEPENVGFHDLVLYKAGNYTLQFTDTPTASPHLHTSRLAPAPWAPNWPLSSNPPTPPPAIPSRRRSRWRCSTSSAMSLPPTTPR